MKAFVLATSNPGKLREIQALLGDLGIEIRAQHEFNVAEAEETGLTFVENALIKARNASRHTGLPALADDSGLAVDALDGAPGIYSARYAGAGASDADNNKALLAALADTPEEARNARFICVLVMLRHWQDPTPLIFTGVWEGQILFAPRGCGGFGYDPLFQPAGLEISSAELEAGEKNRISHRGQALAALRETLATAGIPGRG